MIFFPFFTSVLRIVSVLVLSEQTVCIWGATVVVVTTTGWDIDKEYEPVALTGCAAASVAVTVTLKVPPAVGVPLKTPVAALIERPAGRPLAAQVYGPVPPAACTVAEYADVVDPPGRDVVAIATAGTPSATEVVMPVRDPPELSEKLVAAAMLAASLYQLTAKSLVCVARQLGSTFSL